MTSDNTQWKNRGIFRFSLLISFTVSVKKKIHNYHALKDYDSRRRKCEIIA